MQHIETLTLGIQYKSKQLTEQVLALHDEINALKQRYTELEGEIRQKNELITDLEQKQHISQIKKAVEKGGDTAESKKKINELLRELDRCIDFLSNK